MKATLQGPWTLAQNGGASFAAYEICASHFSWDWHYHPEIELTWISKGRGMRLVGDHSDRYGPDDLVLLGANLPHTWASDPPQKSAPHAHRAVGIRFYPLLVPDSLLELSDFSSVAQMMVLARRGLRFPAAAAATLSPLLLALLAKKGLEAWVALIEILGQLSTRTDFKVLASEQYRNQRTYHLNSRLERVLTFMDENCGDHLDLAAAAQVAHLSPSAFSRFFHKMTGKTFLEHRNICRVREACRLLIQTDQSVTDIAYKSGFRNLANFNRQFLKQKQLSPLKYQRLYRPS